MARTKKQNIHFRIIKHLREAHRLLGIWLALFLVFLAFTGILINHGNALSLDTSHVNSTLLLDHYGVKPPNDIKKYPLKNVHDQSNIYVVDNQVWYKQALLVDSQQRVVSVGSWLEFIVIVSSNKLYLFTLDSELVDVLDSTVGLPNGVNDISIIDDSVYLHTLDGVFLSVDHFETWQRVDFMPKNLVNKVEESVLTSAEKHQLSLLNRQQKLSWERVVLDIHSGRFLGEFGVWLMDVVAILIIILSMSGVYIWIRQSRAKRR